MALLIRLARALHAVHPEVTHRVGSLLLSIPLPPCRCERMWEVGAVRTCGPVGVAAGFDKSGMYARFLSFFCPGFIVVGSTLPYRRRGNKPPRAARLYPYSLVNAMGLNSPGIATVLSRVAKLRYPIFISLAGFDTRDFLTQLKYVERYFKPAAIELNISSPTYRGFWQTAPELEIGLPVFVKIGPSTDLQSVARHVRRLGWGLVVTNTMPVGDPRLSTGVGGLSGLLLYKYGLRLLEKMRAMAEGVPIIYSGGVFTCSQVREVLKLAQGVEVLTALYYFTPAILRLLNRCVDKASV
ncbi:MAG: dihydroorotate dehydrogenase 2 [Pyrobaculum sp.]